jgi:DNA-binding response OmpR family regulator
MPMSALRQRSRSSSSSLGRVATLKPASRIVDDLLLLAKSERPDFVRPEPVELAELTSDVDAKIRALGERHWQLEAIGESTRPDRPTPHHSGHGAVGANAVQSADVITIGSALRLGKLTFWITDSGPGISPQDAETIFEQFSRGSTGGAGSPLRSVDRASEVTVLSVNRVTLDLRTRRAQVGERTIDLTAREFTLLELFLRHPDQVLSREQTPTVPPEGGISCRVCNYRCS